MSNTRQPIIIELNKQTESIIKLYIELGLANNLDKSLIAQGLDPFLGIHEKIDQDRNETSQEGWLKWGVLQTVGIAGSPVLKNAVGGLISVFERYQNGLKNENQVQYVGFDYIANLSSLVDLKIGDDLDHQEKNVLIKIYGILSEYEENKRIKLNSWLNNFFRQLKNTVNRKKEDSIDEESLLVVTLLARKIRKIYQLPKNERTQHYNHLYHFIQEIAKNNYINKNTQLYTVLGLLTQALKQSKLIKNEITESLLAWPTITDEKLSKKWNKLKQSCRLLLNGDSNSLQTNTLLLALPNKNGNEISNFVNQLPNLEDKKSIEGHFYKIYQEYVLAGSPTIEEIQKELKNLKYRYKNILGHRWNLLEPIFKSEENINLLANLMMAEYEVRCAIKELPNFDNKNNIQAHLEQLEKMHSKLEYYFVLHVRLRDKLYVDPLHLYPNEKFYKKLSAIVHDEMLNLKNALHLFKPELVSTVYPSRTKWLRTELEQAELKKKKLLIQENKVILENKNKNDIKRLEDSFVEDIKILQNNDPKGKDISSKNDSEEDFKILSSCLGNLDDLRNLDHLNNKEVLKNEILENKIDILNNANLVFNEFLELKKSNKLNLPEIDLKTIRQDFLDVLKKIKNTNLLSSKEKIHILEHAKKLPLFNEPSTYPYKVWGRTDGVVNIDKWINGLSKPEYVGFGRFGRGT